MIKSLLKEIGSYFGKNYPKEWISFRYFLRFHKRINWKNPKTLNEKILYLSIMTDTTLWTQLADKYRVRVYIEKCGYKDNLVKLYGVWENASEIDFERLPKSFVLKANHGSGEIILVKDKNKIDKNKIVEYLNKEISKPYGAFESGKHYQRIKPCIIAEELLINDEISQKYSTSIIDYKIWCFNGVAHYIGVYCNRDKNGYDFLYYDINWNDCPEYIVPTKRNRRYKVIPKPIHLSEMISMAETLSKPFPCVRVDLYNIGGKIYFGEMTFTSHGGMMVNYTNYFLNKAGDLIDLNYKG